MTIASLVKQVIAQVKANPFSAQSFAEVLEVLCICDSTKAQSQVVDPLYSFKSKLELNGLVNPFSLWVTSESQE